MTNDIDLDFRKIFVEYAAARVRHDLGNDGWGFVLPEEPDPRLLLSLLTFSWSHDTCAPGYRARWVKERPAFGQFAVTALVVNDVFGGSILRRDFERPIAADYVGPNFFNKVERAYGPPTFLDFTGSTFPDAMAYRVAQAPRTQLLASDAAKAVHTTQRYTLLKRTIHRLMLREIGMDDACIPSDER